MKIPNNKRALFIAHYLQKNAVQQMPLSNKSIPVNWSDRLKLAWYLVHLREQLAKGIVTFSFWKKDHSIREAKGTLHPLLIPADKRPKGNDQSPGASSRLTGGAASAEKGLNNDQSPITNYQSIPFFDIDKGEWRSFSVTHFIGFVTYYEIKAVEEIK